MKKLNQLKMVAVLVVGTLLPTVASAASVSNSEMEGLLKPVTNGLAKVSATGSNQEAITAALKEKARETEEFLAGSKEELKLRDKLGELTEENNTNKALDQYFTAYRKSKQDEAAKEADRMSSALKKFGSISGDGVSAEDVDTSGINKACSEVGLDRFQSLDSAFRTSPAAEATKLFMPKINEMKEKAKEAKQKEIADGFTKWLKDVEKDDKEDEDVAEPDMKDGLAHLDMDKPEGLTLDNRTDRLKADIKEQKIRNRKDGKAMVLNLRDLMLGMLEKDEKDQDLHKLTGPFVKNLQEYRQALAKAGVKAVKKAHKKCEEQAKLVGRDQPRSPKTKLSNARLKLVGLYGEFPGSLAEQYFQKLTAEARVLQCRKGASKVEEKLGAKMQAKIAALDSVTDGAAFLEGAVAVMSELGKNSKEVGKSLKKPVKDCDKIAKFAEKLDGFADTVAQETTKQQQQGQGPGANQTAFGGQRRQQGLMGAPVHNGSQQNPI